MRRLAPVAVILVFAALALPPRTSARADEALWQFAFTAVFHGARGNLLVLDGAASFDQERGWASGGGSVLHVGGSGQVSAGHWSIVTLVGWRLPEDRLRPGRPQLDLDLLVSLPLPDRPVALAQISFETFEEQGVKRLTMSLAHPDFLAPGSGTLVLRKRPL